MRFSEIRSPGLKTDIEINRFGNILKERDEYLVIETPDNPGYYWGNYLIFPNAPEPNDQKRWESFFSKEFAHQPKVKHKAFTWDSPYAGTPFNGYERDEASELLLRSLKKPQTFNAEVEVRALTSDKDWDDAIHNQMSIKTESFAYEPYFVFKRNQMQRYRRLATNSQGNWYGAFLHGSLVADCGFFCFDGIGRFQSVVTHPDFRRRGICATLIFECIRQNPQGRETIIVAEPGAAERVYRSVGFEGSRPQYQLTKRPTHEE